VLPATKSWQQRIDRAERLASEPAAAAALLRFYAGLLRQQKQLFDRLAASTARGSLEFDSRRVVELGADLLRWVAASGPADLAREARSLLDGPESGRTDLLLTYWRSRSDRLFFSKALLQPYAEWLALAQPGAIGGAPSQPENRCPRCSGMPQVSILRSAGSTSGDGSSRALQCATCLMEWPFRRVVCPSCGNEDEHTLGYYQSPTWPHVRIDACNRCNRYLKSVDLGIVGVAIPLVDEIAAAPLDVWATEHGYKKIELSLVGL